MNKPSIDALNAKASRQVSVLTNQNICVDITDDVRELIAQESEKLRSEMCGPVNDEWVWNAAVSMVEHGAHSRLNNAVEDAIKAYRTLKISSLSPKVEEPVEIISTTQVCTESSSRISR